MKKQRMRLADLNALSKVNAEARAACVQALHRLSRPPQASEIKETVERLHPPLLDEIIVAGARALMATVRRTEMAEVARAPAQFAEEREKRQAAVQQFHSAARAIVRRVEVGSRVVELLDSIQISGKKLGDCTQRDVLLEADRETRRAEALADRAEWLRALAKVLEPNQTVRTADRNAVLAVLREVAA